MAEAERGGLGSLPRAGSRTGMALWGLWIVAGLLAVRQAAAVLRLPPERRFTDLERWIGENGVLHVRGSLYDTDTFTGTPFAGLVLKPLTKAAEDSLGIVWTFGTLLLVVAVALVAARALPGPAGRRTTLFAAPVALILAALSLPVRNTFTLGQTSIIPVLLVLLGCCLPRLAGGSGRMGGALVGLAAALQPAVLLFAPLLWLTGRRRAAVTGGVTFGLCTALAWVTMADDSWTYWVHHIAGAGLGHDPGGLANQSLHGLLLRIGLRGPAELALYGLLTAVVVVLGLRRATRYARDGQILLATAVTGCVAVAVSPTAWQHQQLWILLAVVGRAGRRRADRLVWPVLVVLVMTLTSTVLVPPNPVFRARRRERPAARGPRRGLRGAVPDAHLAAVGPPRADPGRRAGARPVPLGAAARLLQAAAEPSEPVAGADADTGRLLGLLLRPCPGPPDSRSLAESHG
ncbi:hypothetical protein GCM10020000_57170 [Streptomyces olivoverticillatus]